VVEALEAGHPDMKILTHNRGIAFVMAEVSGELLRMSPCRYDAKSDPSRSASGASQPGMATLFRLVRPQGETGAAITLYWKKSASDWRISSYAIAED
jgi:hypothetical protein